MKRTTREAEERAERAWHALHCLPRDAKGEPPTYRDLEEKVGLSNGVISRIMLGQREPTLGTLQKLAKALNVSSQWLLDGTGDPPKLTGPKAPRLPYRIQELSGGHSAHEEPENLKRALAALELAAREHPDATVTELLVYAQLNIAQNKS